MKKQQTFYDYEGWSWLNCIGDIYYKTEEIKQNSNQTIFKKQQLIKNEQTNFQIIQTKCEDIDEQQQSLKRKIQNFQQEQKNQQNLFWTQNSSSNEQQKKGISFLQQKNTQKLQQNKQKKQHIYSKNYRQKKKQQMKILQEQNQILRKKITELQFRLRQKQIEINRIKNPPPSVQLKVDQLNEKLIKTLSVTIKDNQDFLKKQQEKKTIQINKQLRQEIVNNFYKSFDKRGFGGTDKIQSMNYYFNQVLECSLRDSQKYLCMLCYKNKDNKNINEKLQTFLGYQYIHNVFYQIFKINQQKQFQLKKIFKEMQPFFIDFKNLMTSFYGCFQKIIALMKKIHAYIRNLYPKDFTLPKNRIKLQQWFQQNKYSRLLRRLRTEWFDMIRNDQEQTQNPHKKTQTTKKKKVQKSQ